MSTSPIISFFAPRKVFLWISLVTIFGIGLGIRLFDLTDLPLDFQSTRQLHSALIARGMYYRTAQGVPQWQRDMAQQQWKKEGLIEPQIFEWITSQTYRVIGQDALWVPRIYSILFWMLGGVALFLLAREMSGVDGGVIGLAYFLVLPYGVIASRSFQPDPLMTSLIVYTYWIAVRWLKTPTCKWTVAAGLLGGAAILIKSVAVFFVAPAWIGLILFSYQPGENVFTTLKNAVCSLKLWILAFLTLIPYAIYHVYGIYITGELVGQFSLRFFPQLWLDPAFYLRWKGMIASTVGFEWFLMALLSVFLVRERSHRALLLGAWIGYFLYGMTLDYTISTHDYYQLPFLPLVALGLACGAELLLRNLRGTKVLLYGAVIGVALFAVSIKAWDVLVTLKRTDYRQEAVFWQKLGKQLGDNKSIVGLTQDYGYRLSYWGWVDTTQWMSTGDFNLRTLDRQTFDMQKLFEQTVEGKDYFVVTMLGELDNQPKLKSLLEKNYPLLVNTGDTFVFDLKHPKKQN